MSPGAVEEAGQTARTVITTIGSQPLVLALVLMNMALLVFTFYQNHEMTQTRERTGQLIVTWQTEVSKLLANCVPMRDMQDMLKQIQPQPQPPSPPVQRQSLPEPVPLPTPRPSTDGAL